MSRIMKPEARKDIINWLNEHKIVPTSMMDISDGLSSELFHITTKSNVGCTIYEDKIPVHTDTQKMAMDLKMASVTAALNGGEDYELLFTIPQGEYEKITMSEQISVIGHITKETEGRKLITNSNNTVELEAQGWNPLKK